MEMLGRGDAVVARALAEESVQIVREKGEVFDVAHVLANLGLVAHTQGDYATARPILEESMEICRRIGDNWLLSLPYRHLGYMELREGNYDRATALFREGLSALRGLREKWFIARAVETLAITAAVQGDHARAARLFGAGAALREAVGASVQEFYRADYDRGVAAAREGLGEAAWEDALAQGRAMSPEEAIEYALSDEETAPSPGRTPAGGAEDVPLSRREQEVALLIARGLTNAQIAERLWLSERTVSTHVRKILRKLGVRSREQVGDLLADRKQARDPA
jgi:non-specific serine/threonine protein kinase